MGVGKCPLLEGWTVFTLHFLLLWVWGLGIVSDSYRLFQARFRVFICFCFVLLFGKTVPSKVVRFWSVFFSYYHEKPQRSCQDIFNKEPHLLLAGLCVLFSRWVLNEWYPLGIVLNYRLGWDNSSLNLIFFLRMAPIIWQKILKGRFLERL